jgi:D-alanyl-D-alanine carboxypeptidase/D-alanyl-D-alanine-endopeptidase (penicillin-binding protein 4)
MRTSVFDDWLAALKKRGIGHVKGKVYYVQNCFDDEWIHPTWSRGYLTDWYAAPVTGLNFSTNCVDIEVFPTEIGQPARYEVHPAVKNVEVINKTVTSTLASTRPIEMVEVQSGTTRPVRRAATKPVDIDRRKDANVYTIFGAVTKKEELSSKPVTDPGGFFVDAMRTHFASNGFTIDGPSVEAKSAVRLIGAGMTPKAEKIVAVHETTVRDVLWRINKNSQNYFAEALSKLNGEDFQRERGEKEPKGSWAKGSDAAHAFLRKYHIDDSKIRIIDGSGLSRENRVTARGITDLLATMHDHQYAQTFFDSLAIGGRDGTIRSRMKDLNERVHAKTGFVGGVRSLSGYVKTRSGKTLCFCIIYNHIPESELGVKPFEQMQDDACRAMVEGM